MSVRAGLLVDDAPVRPQTALAALDRVRAAVVLHDGRRREVHRNTAAAALLADRHAGALARAALRELVGAVRSADRPLSRRLDIYGPPPRSLDVTAVLLDDGSVMGMIEDATEVSQLEQVRRDFVANVSHELRTPIGAVLLLAEALEGEGDKAVVDRLVGRLVEEAERAAAVVQGLLDLSRLEAGSQEPPTPIEVADIITTAVRTVSAQADRAGVELAVASAAPGLVVLGDRIQLCSALSNLLDNAVKYSDRGGVVDVVVREDDGDVVVAVRDHGPGIPSADLDRVFERFYRVDRARSRDTGGTGLGLAIVRHIAVNHGGEVAAASVEGEGATFTLRLPLQAGPAGNETGDGDG